MVEKVKLDQVVACRSASEFGRRFRIICVREDLYHGESIFWYWSEAAVKLAEISFTRKYNRQAYF